MERTSSPLLQAQTSFQPKGRGRPRASYAQTGEFDLGLIREYHSRPALYDRTNKLFKDKIHVAQLWMQISHKLGYDVNMLRERMITLRNRYNIEKRRVESSSMSSMAGSQWPLFENLSFLSDHIRTRRSYKTQSKSIDGRQDDDDDEEPFDVDDMNSDSNGHVKRIKHEVHTDYDDIDDFDCDRQQLPVTAVLNMPRKSDLSSQHVYNTLTNGNDAVNGKSSHQDTLSVHLTPSLRQPDMPLNSGKRGQRGQGMLEEEPQYSKRQRLDAMNNTAAAAAASAAAAVATSATAATYPKFRAFGEFVSHSLTELPHSMSMRLVEMFTRELVQAAIASEPIKQDNESDNHSSIEEIDD